MKTLHLSIILAGTIFTTIFSICMMSTDANAISSTNKAQFQLKVNQTFSVESYGITVKFLNVTSDSRCPSDVTCIWQGEAKVLVNIIENNQDRGNFILSTLVGHDQIVFGTHALHLMQVNPFVSSTKKISNTDYEITLEMSGVNIEPPLKQFKSGIAVQDITCNRGLQLIIKSEDNSPACVKPDTVSQLVQRGWTKSPENIFVTLAEGQREGPLLVQKIFSNNVQGLSFQEFPLATNVGNPVTLHIGDSISNGCTVELTLVKISNGTTTFLKKENLTRLCPICLSENTGIDTPNGPVNIKNLKIGMTILTQDSYGNLQTGTILKTGRTLASPDHMMVHVVLSDKRELYVSPNHPTADGRFFGELLAGDALDGSKIKNVEQVPYNGTYTYDLLPSGQTGFYWANGILIESTLK
jgi:hypothetical protein